MTITLAQVQNLGKKIAYNLKRLPEGKVRIAASSLDYFVTLGANADKKRIMDSLFFRRAKNQRTIATVQEYIISFPTGLVLRSENCVKQLCIQVFAKLFGDEEEPLFIAFEHRDTDNTHFHVLTTLLKEDGTKFNTSFIKRKSLRATAELFQSTKFHDLFEETDVSADIFRDYAVRGYKRKGYYSTKRLETSGRIDMKEHFQQIIEAGLKHRKTLQHFLAVLMSYGIYVSFIKLPTKKVGVTYSLRKADEADVYTKHRYQASCRELVPTIDRDYYFSGSNLGAFFQFDSLCENLTDCNEKNSLLKLLLKDRSGRDINGREIIKYEKRSNRKYYSSAIEIILKNQAVRFRMLHYLETGQIEDAFKTTQDKNYQPFKKHEIENESLAILVSFFSLKAFTHVKQNKSEWDRSRLDWRLFLREREEMEAGLNSILLCVANKTKDKKKLFGILMNAPLDLKKMFANSALKLAGITHSFHVEEYAPTNHHLLQFCRNFTKIDLSLFAIADDMFLTWKSKMEHSNYVHPAFRGIDVTRENGIAPSRGMSR
jgi:hypothetical protein